MVSGCFLCLRHKGRRTAGGAARQDWHPGGATPKKFVPDDLQGSIWSAEGRREQQTVSTPRRLQQIHLILWIGFM